jgi:IMP dehydrogenase
VWSVSPGDTVYNATKLMADKDVGALMEVDGIKIVGIVTERDYARNVFLNDSSYTACTVVRIHRCFTRAAHRNFTRATYR